MQPFMPVPKIGSGRLKAAYNAGKNGQPKLVRLIELVSGRKFRRCMSHVPYSMRLIAVFLPIRIWVVPLIVVHRGPVV
jgi:hypothetical protein